MGKMEYFCLFDLKRKEERERERIPHRVIGNFHPGSAGFFLKWAFLGMHKIERKMVFNATQHSRDAYSK